MQLLILPKILEGFFYIRKILPNQGVDLMKELVKLQKIELERDSRKIFEIEQLVIKS